VGYKNAVYKALDDYYQKALKTAWNHLEPKELEALKKQVKDLRKKKGY
jgi:TRAP-type C4-dicarboxylate transport system substrate-binding protein